MNKSMSTTSKVAAAALFAILLWSGSAQTTAAEVAAGSCTLKGGVRAPAIIIVYEETPQGGEGPVVLPEQWIQRDDPKNVTSQTERIRYRYKFKSGDSWSDSVGAGCRGNGTVIVP
jgi:hypothetical protein